MKTKLIIIGAAVAALLYSCSDREDDVNTNQPVQKSNQENFKLNQNGGASIESMESSVKSDSTRVFESSGTVPPVIPGDDGGEIVHPGDVKPPKGGK